MLFGSGYSYLWGPIAAFAIVGFFILVLRWSASNNTGSLLARRTRAGAEDQYGLLTAICAPGSQAEGERLRALLGLAGVRGTLTRIDVGLRIFVFPADAPRARQVLADADEHPPPPTP
ncbi:MAG: hypothetical protein ACT4PP_06950 [Sporichthyaceae bacterium]